MQLIPHYQTIQSFKTNELLGFEATIKAFHQGEFLGIGDILRRAARPIPKLDRAIHTVAVRDFAGEGLLFVNAFPQTLMTQNLDFPRNLNYSRLVLEITEQTPFPGDLDAVARYLAPFRALGMRVALDDYGAGWSNLSRIEAFNPEFIKLDGSLILNLTSNPRTRTLISAVVLFAERCGIELIAEGVETMEQAHILRELGVKFGQGFYFDLPQSADALWKVVSLPSKGG